MPIIVNLDVMLAKRKVSSKELAQHVGITAQNLSVLKTGKAKAIKFSTLEAICLYLKCQPGDVLEYIPDEETGDDSAEAEQPETQLDSADSTAKNKLTLVEAPPKSQTAAKLLSKLDSTVANRQAKEA